MLDDPAAANFTNARTLPHKQKMQRTVDPSSRGDSVGKTTTESIERLMDVEVPYCLTDFKTDPDRAAQAVVRPLTSDNPDEEIPNPPWPPPATPAYWGMSQSATMLGLWHAWVFIVFPTAHLLH